METYERQSYTRADISEERAGQAHVQRMTVYGEPRRAEMIRQTYRLLAVGVFAAMAGGWLGARSETIIRLFLGPIGWVVAMLLLNFLPAFGLNLARRNPRAAVGYLGLHGFVAGLVLSPLLFVAMLMSGNGDQAPNLIQGALVITAAVFAGISFYVMRSGSEYRPKMSLMNGAFWALMSACIVHMWIGGGVLGLLISCGVGLFGAVQLTWATASVLNNPEFDEPVLGAMMLFAGLFNLFQAVLRLLLGSRR